MRGAWGIAAGVVAVGALGAGAGFRNGDAAVYAAQAWSGELGERPIHGAYILLAWLIGLVVGERLPVALDLVTAVSAGVLVAAAASLVKDEGRAVTALLVAIAVAPEASYGEVDLPWLALLALSAAVRGPIVASGWAALAVAVSPTALAALPWVVAERWRREGPAGGLPAVGGLCAALGLMLVSGWWDGDRGVSAYAPDPWVTALAWARRSDLVVAAAVLAIAGLPSVGSRWWGVVATAGLVLAPADVPAWLLPAVALSIAAGDAWSGLSLRGRAVGALVVLWSFAASVGAWRATRERVLAENAVVAHVAEAMGPGDGLVAPWSWGVRVSVAATGEPYGARWRAAGTPVRDQAERWCEGSGRIVVLPPGAEVSAGEGIADEVGVLWYSGPEAAQWGCVD